MLRARGRDTLEQKEATPGKLSSAKEHKGQYILCRYNTDHCRGVSTLCGIVPKQKCLNAPYVAKAATHPQLVLLFLKITQNSSKYLLGANGGQGRKLFLC